jgi:hypothetical protein
LDEELVNAIEANHFHGGETYFSNCKHIISCLLIIINGEWNGRKGIWCDRKFIKEGKKKIITIFSILYRMNVTLFF